jgi:NAD-dependent dihydropyrimidine dehydrogenase PreA subunit
VVAEAGSGDAYSGNEVTMSGQSRGRVAVDVEECKGCGLCVESCPPKCLELLPQLTAYGVHPAHYTGENCTGCGICFYCCPEPGAITVYRKAKQGEPHAATV